jgi:hypothetical protein
MKGYLLLVLCLLLVAVGLGCGPPAERDSGSAGIMAGMCPKCGGTNFDVQTVNERSPETGEPTDYLDITCRDCGHSWRAPASNR